MIATLGVDVGGTGIKGGLVDLEKGELIGERLRILTPHPATPDAVALCVAEVVRHFEYKERFGCGLPMVVKAGVTLTAANVDHSWIGTDAKTLFETHTGVKASILNDADAAGLAEMQYGAGKDKKGVVFMLTFGTGIGCAIFNNGVLLPNTELGHLKVRGVDAEDRASESVRIEREMSWRKWSARIDEYLHELERLFWPDLFIVGGGASKNANKFIPRLTINTPIVPATLLNEAGIVGAALAVQLGYT